MTTVNVQDLHVQCMLRVRNFNSPGLCASDCCQAPAVTAVEMESGYQMWRCRDHEGIRRIETGRVFIHVVRKDVA